MPQLTQQELDQIRNSMATATDEIVIATIKAILSGGIDKVHPDLLRIFTDEINARGISSQLMENRKKKKMKLTESQARRAVRKWLFEFSTDSGVSHRMSTDDKIAGKLGDDREDQPSSTVPQDIPIVATSQMSTQLTHDMPPVEDPDFIPGTVSELGRSVDLLSQMVPHSEIGWFYEKMQELADEAITKGNKVDMTDGLLDDEMDLEQPINARQKASQEAAAATNESWNRWSRMLAKTLNEAKPRRNKNDPLNLKNRPLTRHDMKLTRPDDDDFDDDFEDDDVDSTQGPPGPVAPAASSMGGEVVDGEYQGSYEDFLDMADEFGVEPETLPGFERAQARRGVSQEDVMAGNMDGEQARLQQLVDTKVFPNITTVDGMSKMIKKKIDPIVHIFFVANDLHRNLSQFMRSDNGLFLFFDAISASPLFTDQNVAELKGVHEVIDALVRIEFESGRKKKRVPKKYRKQLARDSKALKSKVKQYATTKDPVTDKTPEELYAEYESVKEVSRTNLMDSGMFSAIMAEIVMEPILRKWSAEVRDGNIDLTSSTNTGQVTWEEAGTWIEEVVKGPWSRMKDGRKGKKVKDALQGRMEFLDAMAEARDEAEYAAVGQ